MSFFVVPTPTKISFLMNLATKIALKFQSRRFNIIILSMNSEIFPPVRLMLGHVRSFC